MIKKRYKTPMAKFHELKGARLLLSASDENLRTFDEKDEIMNLSLEEEQW